MAPAHHRIQRIGIGVVALLGALLLLLAVAAPAVAGPGDPDAAFGGGAGFVTTDAGADETAYDAFVLPDGKLLAAGSINRGTLGQSSFAAVRYLADGTLDTTYGTGGVAEAAFGQNATAQGAVVLPDGKVVVVGYVSATSRDTAIARFTSTGLLDSSFSGDGLQIIDFTAGQLDSASSVARQSDGRLVVAGTVGSSSTAAFSVLRLNPDGSLDTSFSADGKTTVSFTGGGSTRGVTVAPDGKIVAVGTAGGLYSYDFGVARLLTGGALDTSFSDDGTQVTNIDGRDFPYGVAVQSNGRLVVGGYSDDNGAYDFELVRYTASGLLDTSFSADGMQVTDLGAVDSAFGMLLAPDGDIVLSGSSGSNAAIARYTASGDLDTTFSGDGIVLTDTGAADDVANGVALQPDDKLVAAGSAFDDFAVFRYQGVDTEPPDTTINSGPLGSTNDTTPTFSFSSNEPAGTFQCSVDSASYTTCSSPYTLGPLTEGAHSFRVRAVDQAGNVDLTPALRVFTVDTTPPQTTIDSGPIGLTNDATPTFAFSSGEAGATFQHRVDGGSWYAAASPLTLATLAEGAHVFEVRATDAAGNADASPASRAFTVDSVAPNTTIDSGPSGATNDTTPTFAFSSESGATFQCRVDGGGWTACTSPHTLAALAEGAHTFEVRATDQAGNVDPTPASRSLTVDTAAPETTIESGPSGPVDDATPTFAFSAGEPGAHFEYSIDFGPFESCQSPHTFAALPDGSHTVRVRAIDAAGNADPSPASRTFVVDTRAPVAPELIRSDPGSPANDNSPRLKGAAESGSTVRIYANADGSGSGLAEAPAAQLAGAGVEVQVADDSRTTFHATATDAAGNVSPVSQPGLAYVEDSTAPQTALDSAPTGTIANPAPAFAFSANEPGARFECQIDAGPATPCGSPVTIGPLADGPHVFAVRAIDAAGNADSSPAAATFTVSTKTPDVSLDLRATATATQRLKRGIAIRVRSAAEPCRVTVSGRLSVPVGKHVKRYALPKVSRSLVAGKSVAITLKPPSKARTAAARALARHKKVTARITARGTDAAGNVDTVTLTVKLRP